MGGDVVRLDNGGGGVDCDVHIDNKGVAIFAGAQMVEGDDAGGLLYFFADVAFDLFGEGAFEQLLYAGSGEFIGYPDNEQSHDKRGDGVEYAPVLAQKHGARYADEGAYRREGIGAVVPAVGDDRRTVDFAPYDNGIPVEPLFDHDRDGGHDERQIGGPFDDTAVEDLVYLHAARVEDTHGDDKEGETDEHGGERLVFAMPVGVVAIFVFRGDFDEDDNDKIGNEIR